MNFKYKKIALAAALYFAAIAPAHAVWASNMYEAVNAVAASTKAIIAGQNTTAAAIQAQTIASALNVSTTVSQSAQSLDARMKGSMEAQSAQDEATFKLEHAEAQNLAVRKIALEEASKLRGAACGGGVAAIAAGRIKAANAGTAGSAAGRGLIGTKQDLISLSPQNDLEQKLKNRRATYCDQTTMHNCPVDAKPELKNADISASSVFFGAGSHMNGQKSTYSVEQVAAANAYVANIIKPIKEPALDAKSENTPAGRAYVQLKVMDSARNSLARLPFDILIAKRDPKNVGTHLSNTLKAIWKKESYVTVPAGPISIEQMNEIEVSKRYGNEKWHKNMESESESGIQREISNMLAFVIYQNNEKAKRDDMQLTILAAMYHEQSQIANAPKLAAQKEAALR